MIITDGTVRSYCRICQGFCGTELTIEAGRIARIRGDRADPVSHGYACFKGLQAPEQHHGPGRLLQPLRRDADGTLVPCSSADALAEAGTRLAAIRDRHGPQAIGFFMGTQSLFNTLDAPLIGSFAAALGTPRLFGTMTIDQSAKWIGEARLGGWHAGPQSFEEADVWMLVGSNPLVSTVAAGGAQQFAFSDPVRAMKRAKARGMRLIVIDPRLSETADHADLVLRPRPGTDATLIAGLLHIILAEGWQDAAFCADHVEGLDTLRAALAPFTPEACAARTGVSAEDMTAAAAMFARDARSGMAGSGTGANMGPDSNLGEHLIQALNVVCGRFPRAGERVANPGVLQPGGPVHAEVLMHPRSWESGPRSRTHGLGTIRGQMMTAELVDEILPVAGDSMRALVCVGGNPFMALPDQDRAREALAALDLLIVIDPRLTATARLADFVLAPTLHYERADHSWLLEKMFRTPFAHMTDAAVAPPEGADLVDDAVALWSLARSLGLTLSLGGSPLATDQVPDRAAMLAQLATGSRIPFEAVRDADGGTIFPGDDVRIQPARPGAARFQLLPDDVASELADLAGRATAPAATADFALIVHRHREVMNSAGTDLAATNKRMPVNPAHFHPDDIAALALAPGDAIEIVAASGRIGAVVEEDARLARGTVAMAHCWSGRAGASDEATNRLVDATHAVETINRMPRMTGIPIRIERVSS